MSCKIGIIFVRVPAKLALKLGSSAIFSFTVIVREIRGYLGRFVDFVSRPRIPQIQ